MKILEPALRSKYSVSGSWVKSISMVFWKILFIAIKLFPKPAPPLMPSSKVLAGKSAQRDTALVNRIRPIIDSFFMIHPL
jgi:hypothetical protein